MKKIYLISIFVILILSLTNFVSAITATTLTPMLSIKYYNVPSTVTRSIGVRNDNAYPATVTFEASSNIAGMIQFSENSIILSVGESRYVDFTVFVTQEATYHGNIQSKFYVPEDNFPNFAATSDVTIAKGTPVCVNGNTQDCTVGECAGTQTCQNSQWGECVKNDALCGCVPDWDCTWGDCTDGKQYSICTDKNNCGIEYSGMSWRPCNPDCTETWTCTAWTACSCTGAECENMTQTKTCTDSNNCGTEYEKPEGEQSCPYCGDNKCNNGETCSSCLVDCGACPPPSGGSPGGGSSPSNICIPKWNCTVWTTCSQAGTQTRTCTEDLNHCKDSEKPEEIRKCTYIPTKKTNTTAEPKTGIQIEEKNATGTNIDENQESENKDPDNTEETSSTPTGAAILQNFNLSTVKGKLNSAVALLVIIAVVGGFVFLKRKK